MVLAAAAVDCVSRELGVKEWEGFFESLLLSEVQLKTNKTNPKRKMEKGTSPVANCSWLYAKD